MVDDNIDLYIYIYIPICLDVFVDLLLLVALLYFEAEGVELLVLLLDQVVDLVVDFVPPLLLEDLLLLLLEPLDIFVDDVSVDVGFLLAQHLPLVFQVQQQNGILRLLRQTILQLFLIHLPFLLMSANQLLLHLRSLVFIYLHFLIPKLVELLLFFLMGFLQVFYLIVMFVFQITIFIFV